MIDFSKNVHLTPYPISILACQSFKMLCSLSVLAIDASLGRFDASALPDQAIMELLFENMHETNKNTLRAADGSFKPISEWELCEVGKDETVTQITITATDFMSFPDMQYIPRRAQKLYIFGPGPSGSIETANLPPSLSTLLSSRVQMTGDFDMRTLPPAMEDIIIGQSGFSGSFDLRALPLEITEIRANNNNFCGSLYLENLPPKLRIIDLTKNQMSGSTCLDSLPANFICLHIADNQLSGNLSFAGLNDEIYSIDISNNQFLRSFVLPGTVKSLQTLKAKRNQFSGVAVVHRRYAADGEKCDLRGNTIQSVVDASGQPHPEGKYMLQGWPFVMRYPVF